MYVVYFDQVNQTRYEIEDAKDTDDAIKKAERLWRKENGEPSGVHVEKDGEPVF